MLVYLFVTTDKIFILLDAVSYTHLDVYKRQVLEQNLAATQPKVGRFMPKS